MTRVSSRGRWEGEYDGKSGFFPRAYVELIDNGGVETSASERKVSKMQTYLYLFQYISLETSWNRLPKMRATNRAPLARQRPPNPTT